jgi:hypothetical protein
MKRTIASRNNENEPTLRRTISVPFIVEKNELKEYLEHYDFVYCVEEDNELNEWKVWVDICEEETHHLTIMGTQGISHAWNTYQVEKFLEEGIFNHYSYMSEIYQNENSDVNKNGKILRCYIIQFKD